MTNPTQQTAERETTEEEAIAFAHGYAMGRGCDIDLIES